MRERYDGDLKLREGWLCLDFANTVEWHAREHPNEGLKSYPDLVEWAQKVRLLTGHEAQQLLLMAEARPSEAAAALERAVALREAIYRIFSAVIARASPARADITLLNTVLAEALARLRVIPQANRFAWQWADRESTLDWMLWPVAHSAANLLTSKELQRVGECALEGCGWLFFDTSRNQSRRWCSMKACGNVAKARRHYGKIREKNFTQDS
jgi:predicted RNA-binding Zn ribbon-like protein